MSLLTELFGDEAIHLSLDQIKRKIKSLPPTLQEKRAYLLKDYASITGIKLTKADFSDVGA